MSQFSPGEGAIPAVNQMNQRAIASQQQATRLAQLEQEKELTQEEFDLRREELQQRKQLTEKEMQLRNQQFEQSLSAEQEMQKDQQEFTATQNELQQEFRMEMFEKEAQRLDEMQRREDEARLAAAEAVEGEREAARSKVLEARQARRRAEQDLENIGMRQIEVAQNNRQAINNMVTTIKRDVERTQQRLDAFDTVQKSISNGIVGMFSAEMSGQFREVVGEDDISLGKSTGRILGNFFGFDTDKAGISRAAEFDEELRIPTILRTVDMVSDAAVRRGYAEEVEPAVLKRTFLLAAADNLNAEQTEELEANLQTVYQQMGKDKADHMFLEGARTLRSLGGADPTTLSEGAAGPDSRAAKLADTISNTGNQMGRTFRTMGVEPAADAEKAAGSMLQRVRGFEKSLTSQISKMQEDGVSPVEAEQFQRTVDTFVSYYESMDPRTARLFEDGMEQLIESRTLSRQLEERAIDAHLAVKKAKEEEADLGIQVASDQELAAIRARVRTRQGSDEGSE